MKLHQQTIFEKLQEIREAEKPLINAAGEIAPWDEPEYLEKIKQAGIISRPPVWKVMPVEERVSTVHSMKKNGGVNT